jgi:hypothetical protein
MVKGYYICDTQEKVRLTKWSRSLSEAVARCKRLNKSNDERNGRVMARFFCGDWEDVSLTMNVISGVREWPVQNYAQGA